MLALEAHVQAHGRGRHILRAALASAVPVDGDYMEGVGCDPSEESEGKGLTNAIRPCIGAGGPALSC